MRLRWRTQTVMWREGDLYYTGGLWLHETVSGRGDKGRQAGKAKVDRWVFQSKSLSASSIPFSLEIIWFFFSGFWYFIMFAQNTFFIVSSFLIWTHCAKLSIVPGLREIFLSLTVSLVTWRNRKENLQKVFTPFNFSYIFLHYVSQINQSIVFLRELHTL